MDFITTFVYQPFLNILVWLYWLTGQISEVPDMGIAVILFAVAVRIILLPLDLVGERSDEEKYKIAEAVKKIKEQFVDNTIQQKEEIRKVMRQSPGAILSEVFTVSVQLIIVLVLYRIFSTGLGGEDMHMLYSFMPFVEEPINLYFLDKYDLSHTNSTLNLIQSLALALAEFLHLSFAPIKASRRDFISLVIFFPVVSFLVFMFLPSGKKVFIIASLCFTIIVRIAKQISYLYFASKQKVAEDLSAVANIQKEV